MNQKKPETLKNAIRAFGSALKGVFRLAPFAAIVIFGITASLIFIIATYSSQYVLFATLNVVSVALVVYTQSKNFGESALALVAGLLAVFSVDWNSGSFIIFSITWIGFAVLVLLISSIRLSMNLESIRRRAALRINPEMYRQIEAMLKKTAESSKLKMLSPIEKAEIQLVFAYANVDISIFDKALLFTEQLHVITDINHRSVAIFVADLLSIVRRGLIIQNFLDSIYKMINEAPYPPEEIFNIIRRTKYAVTQNRLTSDEYFQKIISLLSSGVPPEDVKSRLFE